MLEGANEKVLLEVKNVTLCCQPGVACFPDAVTKRGQKHLRDLMLAKEQGWRAVIFFLVQRGDAQTFSPAYEIDAEYGRLLREAVSCGVEALAYRTRVSPESSKVDQQIPIRL